MPHGSVCSSMICCRRSLSRRARRAAGRGRPAEHRAQRGLRDLRRGGRVGLDLGDRRRRVDDPEVADRVDSHRTLSRVMTSCGGIVSVTVRRSTRTMRSTNGMKKTRPGPASGEQPAEPEHDGALVLAEHADAQQREATAPPARAARRRAASGSSSRFCEAQRLRLRLRGVGCAAAVPATRSVGEACGMRAEVAQKRAASRRRTPAVRAAALSRRLVVPRPRDDHDDTRSATSSSDEAAMEAPRLGVWPRVERAHDLAAVVGVRARALERAAVADVRLRPVAHQPPLVVELVRPQVLALAGIPVIVLRVIV